MGCSLAFTTLPIIVRKFSLMSVEVSISGALMRLWQMSSSVVTCFPFSSTVNRRGAITGCRGDRGVE